MRIRSYQHYAAAALDTLLLKIYSPDQCHSHQKHHAGGFFVLSIQKEE